MKTLLIFITFTLCAHGLDVASLHPLITDAVKQVGGERVNVVEVVKPGANVHKFQPRASDIKNMNRARIIFASGKNLEPYLADLKDSLNANQIIIEVGRTIPSQKVSKEDQIYTCCPNHAVGGIDPHWWHNVRNMERAVRVIEKELIRIDPAGKAIYAANSKAARTRLTQLDRWVKGQVATIPRGKRHLVTAHAAFGYFCKGYGFKASFVQGLSAQGEVSASQLAGAIQQLRKEAIPMVFPEQTANPKVLQQIANQTGAKV
ncbi:metal ABC transporter substrate-binding protein, partial [Akkermansiaceae bacterium]|nr:metal ABC transporter substrate-binding protein [Akkermansiaceae bacterium]